MNLLEPGLAFLEGVALIASPCVLPVLPLVLGASADGGRRRPFGIITGFVLAFTFVAMASRKLVMLTGVEVEMLRNASLVLLFLFGCVLMSEYLSARFSALTQHAAGWGGARPSGGDGFGSGILIGMLIGLVWTPCAGPILAAVLVQVIRQHTDAQSLWVVLSFALGAGVPMLLIALLGRNIMKNLGFLTQHSHAIRKIFGALILLAVAWMAFGTRADALVQRQETPAETSSATTLQDALPAPYPAPELAGIEGWINTSPLTLASLKGTVVLVDFWTYSCINCVRTLPHLTAWDKKYRDQGLVIIGVHAPEFEFEKKLENVTAAVAQRDIHYPVALDNTLATWTNFKNQYWPAHYLIDRDGRVVYTHFGEGKYDVTENNIRFLLGLKDAAAVSETTPAHVADQTPEMYLGYARAARFAGEMTHDAAADYTAPETLPVHGWALKGRWNIAAEKITAQQAGAALRLHFKARKVFLVLGAAGGTPLTAHLRLNDSVLADNAGADVMDNTVQVTGHNLYALVDQKTAAEGVLEITADAPGLEAYAFTFGQ